MRSETTLTDSTPLLFVAVATCVACFGGVQSTGCSSPPGTDGQPDAAAPPTETDSTSDGSESDVPDTDGDSTAACTPELCAGCCEEGRCYPGVERTRCGAEGAQCQTCAEGEICTEGECVEPGCGNGVLDEGEDCDGEAFRRSSCSAIGFDGGKLNCRSDCTYDTSGCTGGNPCEFAEDSGEPDDEFCPGFCHGGVLAQCEFCGPAQMEDELENCGAKGERCVDGRDDNYTGVVGMCVSTEAEPCDPETFTSECGADASEYVRCTSGYTETIECLTGQKCERVDGAPRCLDEASQPCDPAEFEPTCSNGAAVTCDQSLEWTTHRDCLEESTCELHSGQPYCFNDTLGSCDPEEDGYQCHENRGYVCLDGRWVLHRKCTSANSCSESGPIPCNG